MKRFIVILLSVIAAWPAMAQVTSGDLETDLGGRFSVEADKKLAKGLHLTVDGEVRLDNRFSELDRWQAGVGLSYKVNSYLKVGGGYLFIDKLKSSGEWSPRHRGYFDVTGGLRTGDWRFTLKERLQLTYRDASSMNVYQSTPNALALKSRLKAEYKGFQAISPYAFVEARMALNDPACTAKWNGVSYSDYAFTGYTDSYLNRIRGALGVEWKLSRLHALDFTLLGDYCYDKVIDTNAEGTKLKSLSYARSFNTIFCIGYVISF